MYRVATPPSPPFIAQRSTPKEPISVTHVFLRSVQNPLFYALLLTATAVVLTVVLIHEFHPSWMKIAIPVSIGAGLLFLGVFVSCHKRSVFEVSLYYSLNALAHDYNSMLDLIVVGRIPLKSHGDHKKLQDMNVGAVLSLIEDHEYSTGMGFEPVQKEDWQALGIAHKQISATDFNPLSREQICESVAFLEEQARQGKKTYVHCKAGRGRSMTAFLCYYLKDAMEKRASINVDFAISQAKVWRPDLHFNRYQRAAIDDYYEYLKALPS